MKKNIFDSKYFFIPSVNDIDMATIYNDNGTDEEHIKNMVLSEIRKTHYIRSKKTQDCCNTDCSST